jgi:uncharacterized protein involved in exopolysaccharide biosynthesis
MKIVLVLIALVCVDELALAQPASTTCDTIGQLNGRADEYRQQLSKLRDRYTEDHPDVVRLRRALANVETTLADENERARSQGVVCDRSESPR